MPRERVSMRKIKELLRLKFESGLSIRQIAASLHIGVGSVHDYLARVRIAGLKWPLPEALTEQQLEERLFPPPVAPAADNRPRPDWKHLDTELKRKGVTLRLLWEEYRTNCPTGLGYSQFCKRFADFQATLDPRMRQSHKAGEVGVEVSAWQTHLGHIVVENGFGCQTPCRVEVALPNFW